MLPQWLCIKITISFLFLIERVHRNICTMQNIDLLLKEGLLLKPKFLFFFKEAHSFPLQIPPTNFLLYHTIQYQLQLYISQNIKVHTFKPPPFLQREQNKRATHYTSAQSECTVPYLFTMPI